MLQKLQELIQSRCLPGPLPKLELKVEDLPNGRIEINILMDAQSQKDHESLIDICGDVVRDLASHQPDPVGWSWPQDGGATIARISGEGRVLFNLIHKMSTEGHADSQSKVNPVSGFR